MKNQKLILAISLFITVVIIALLIISLGISENEIKEIEKTEKIRIGGILPLTGGGASAGNTLIQGMSLKLQEVENIELFVEDFESDPKKAISAYNKLHNVNNIDIFFTILSSAALNLKPLTENDEVLLFADVSYPGITQNTKNVIRHSNIAESDAKEIADFIYENQYKNVGIISGTDTWGKMFFEFIEKDLKSRNINVFNEGVDVEQKTFKTEINKLLEKKTDVIVIATMGKSGGIIVKELREKRYEGIIVSAISLSFTPEAREIAGEALSGTYYQTFIANDDFKEDYMKVYGEEPSVIGYLGYTDLEILIEAIEKTNSTNPNILSSYIKGMGSFKGKYENVIIEPNGDIILETVIKRWE